MSGWLRAASAGVSEWRSVGVRTLHGTTVEWLAPTAEAVRIMSAPQSCARAVEGGGEAVL